MQVNLQVKREKFHQNIRKEQREKQFKIKREEGLLKKSVRSPNELFSQIIVNLKEKNFQKLLNILKEYNDEYLINLNAFLTSEVDVLKMTEFFTHIFHSEKAQVFLDLLQLGYEQEICLDCLNQTMVIIINLTFLSGLRIGESLLNKGIPTIIINDLLPSLSKSLRFESIFINICQIFINLILDLEYTQQIRLKEIILNSNLTQIWYSMYLKGMKNNQFFFQLFNLLYTGQDINPDKLIEIFQICIDILTQTQFEQETYRQVLRLLIILSEQQFNTLDTMPKQIWSKFLEINQYQIEYTTLFINYLNYPLNSDVYNMGLIENLTQQLKDQKLDFQLINNIVIIFNRLLLSCQSLTLVESCINNLIPYLNTYIFDYTQQDLMEEYIFLLINLFKDYELSDINFEKLIQNLNVIEILTQMQILLPQISLQKRRSLMKWIPELFNSFERLNFNQKRSTYYKLKETSLMIWLSNIELSEHCDFEIQESILNIIEQWNEEFVGIN